MMPYRNLTSKSLQGALVLFLMASLLMGCSDDDGGNGAKSGGGIADIISPRLEGRDIVDDDDDEGNGGDPGQDDGTGPIRLAIPDTISGSIADIGEIDVYTFVLNSSQTIVIQTEGDTDTIGFLVDANGEMITEDDDNGEGTNFLIETNLAPGSYGLAVAGYDLQETGAYSLSISLGQVSTTEEIEPNDSPDTAQPITIPTTVFGQVHSLMDEFDSFQFTVSRSGEYAFIPNDFIVDLDVYLIRADDREQFSSDIDAPFDGPNERFSAFLDAGVLYSLVVESFFEDEVDYEITIEPLE